MPRSAPDSAIVFDLEFTAWQGSMARCWLAPGEFKEVVQIGAVRLEATTLEETGRLNLLVRPRLNPVLSAYLENLTGISNARLKAEGIDFAEAYARFVDFAGRGVIGAFGRDDLVLEENLRLYGLRDAAAMPPYVNVTPWLRANGVEPKGKHACHVGPLCGAAFEGQEHDALDDARSVAAGIRVLVERGAPNLFAAPARA
jgi:inhibitor of KinA sporulation pathway (predicted exonuclease)